jgi:hypothetical protein
MRILPVSDSHLAAQAALCNGNCSAAETAQWAWLKDALARLGPRKVARPRLLRQRRRSVDALSGGRMT